MDFKTSVLLCDNDAPSRLAVAGLLTSIGYQVHTFIGTESVDTLLDNPADVLLLGLNPPDFNAFYLADGLRLGGLRTPLFFMVQNVTAELRDEIRCYSNVRGIIRKPIRYSVMLEQIDNVRYLQHV